MSLPPTDASTIPQDPITVGSVVSEKQLELSNAIVYGRSLIAVPTGETHADGSPEYVIKNAYSLAGAVDIAKQDQHTTLFDFYFVKIKQAPPTTLLNAVTGVSPTTPIHEFDIVDDTGFAVGDYVGIFRDSTAERFFFGSAQSVTPIAGDQATVVVDTPLDYNFPAGSTVASFRRNINLLGTKAAPIIYQVEIGPNSDEEIDLTRMIAQMKTTGTATLGLFGDQAALTNGIVLRVVREDDSIQTIWTIHNNGELALHGFDLNFYTALGQGQEGLAWRYTFNGDDKHGVVVRLSPGDKLQLLIQDDLTGLLEFFIICAGHFVNPT